MASLQLLKGTLNCRTKILWPVRCPASRAYSWWSGTPQSRVLSLGKIAPSSQVPSLGSVLDAARTLAILQHEHTDLCVQRNAEKEEEVKLLYDGEILAAETRIDDGCWQFEVELLHAAHSLGGSSKQDHDVILEVSAGVGGAEAALFAGEMWDMYHRFADARGWSFEEQHFMDGAVGGLQHATARVAGAEETGQSPFSWLRYESGVHRVQRIPATERKGRIQTSTAVVVVLPVPEAADIPLGPNDIRLEISKKSSGPGGQSVNAAHQAVRAVHIPTGMAVQSTTSSSQIENKEIALQMLRARLLAQHYSAQAQAMDSERKLQKGTGDRSEKIRTYNFIRDDVADHVVGKVAGPWPSASSVLFNSDLEQVLQAHREKGRWKAFENALDLIEARLTNDDGAQRGH